MGMQTPADHKITTGRIQIDDMDPPVLLSAIDAEIVRLTKAAKTQGHIIVSHTVTLFQELKTVIVTLHTLKP